MLRPLPPLLLVCGMAVATSSVVRYRWWIVAVYVLLAVLLAVTVALSRDDDGAGAGRIGGGVALLATAVVSVTVKPYTYLTPDQGWAVRIALAITAVTAAIIFLLPEGRPLSIARWRPDIALGIAIAGYVGTGIALILLDPAPRIDVWVTLQQASDAIARGDNIYSQTWTGSPGVQDAFTYLPFTALLLAPGRWLAGDVRWALLAVTVVAALAVRALPGRQAGAASWTASAAAALLLLMPGTPTQVEQAWTEPLLLACLVGWTFGVVRGIPALAVVCLAFGLASKQHLVLLLPVLAAWRGFGVRQALVAGGLAGVFVLPWFLASPADMWHDTVSLLVSFQPLLFADTLYIAAINELGRTPPFWLTGTLVLGTVAAAVVMVRRRQPDLAVVLQWCALVLLVANLVNKQAFYNQYWLVAALVVLSWAVPAGTGLTGPQTPRAPAVAAA